MYGDNVFKKTGINREGAGRHKKTRYFSGKQSIFSREGPASGARIIGQVETGASARSALFFCAQEGPRNGSSGAGHIEGQEPGKPCISRLTRQEGRSTRPGSRSSSRPKRAGFAAHDEIIADGPQKSKGAGRANGALKRAEINTCPGKGPFWALHHRGSRRAELLQAVTRAVQPCATPHPERPKTP